MSERSNDLLTGLFIGGLIGAVLGVLFAPKSGKETREDIARKADEILLKTKEEYQKAVEKSKAAYEASLENLKVFEESAREKVSEMGDKVSEIAHKGAETIESNKNKLKKALDAGLEAYREENNKEKV
jgi:gas vesicle protein